MGKTLKAYTINVHVNLDTTVDVKAENLEEAIVKARELKMHDVVSFEGDFCDGDVTIKGVWEN